MFLKIQNKIEILFNAHLYAHNPKDRKNAIQHSYPNTRTMVFGSTGKDRIHRKFYEDKDVGYNRSEEKRVEKKIEEFNEFVETLPSDIDFTDHNNFKALNYRAKQAINQFRNNRMIIKGYIEAGTPNEWFKIITTLIEEVFNPQLERLSQIEDSYWRKRVQPWVPVRPRGSNGDSETRTRA